MGTENTYTTISHGSSIVRRERDPLSGWVVAFMVLVILVGLGFISLMELASQQADTERAVFELRQELRRNHRQIAERTAPVESVDQYAELNKTVEKDSSSTSPNSGAAAPTIDSD